MHRSILITGANVGLGKETARQLAMNQETERIILACRNAQKAEAAKQELEHQTGRSIFEIVLMDTTKAESAMRVVEHLDGPIDAVVLNAGGMGGRTPEALHHQV